MEIDTSTLPAVKRPRLIWIEKETETEKTNADWKIWAKEQGFILEKKDENTYLIVNSSARTIKVLTKKNR